MAFKVVALGEKVPPTPPSVQVPPVARPEATPLNPAVVLPWQIVCVPPAVTTGEGVIGPIMLDEVLVPQSFTARTL